MHDADADAVDGSPTAVTVTVYDQGAAAADVAVHYNDAEGGHRNRTERHARIVNVSSGMGGISEMGEGYPAYRVSKAALNAITRLVSHEARGDVKVNAVCPGWVRTAMGGPAATRALDEGVASIVWAALLPQDGPNGGFYRDGEPIPW